LRQKREKHKQGGEEMRIKQRRGCQGLVDRMFVKRDAGKWPP